MGRYQLSRNSRVVTVREFYIFLDCAINSKIPAGIPPFPVTLDCEHMTGTTKKCLLASLKPFQPIKPEFQPPKPLKISPRICFASHSDDSTKTLSSAEWWDHCPIFWSALMHYFCTSCTK